MASQTWPNVTILIHTSEFRPPYLENWLSDCNKILQIFSGHKSV